MISLEKSQEVLRGKILELERSLDWSKSEKVQSERELAEYRAKARKILEEKEKFITKLRSGGGEEEDQGEVGQAELEQVSRERNLYQEETVKLAGQLATARQETASLEVEFSTTIGPAPTRLCSHWLHLDHSQCCSLIPLRTS